MPERASQKAGAAVTRFAPSPTGRLHLGGARTALFCWALARASGGRFLLRIEDTDRAREDAGSAAGLLEDLHWLGLDWDEGPELADAGGAASGSPRAGGATTSSPRVDAAAAGSSFTDGATAGSPRADGATANSSRADGAATDSPRGGGATTNSSLAGGTTAGSPHVGGATTGPHFIGGDPRGVGPFFQSRRGAHYEAALQELLARDCAYPAFETPAELDALRAAAGEKAGAKRGFRYRRAADYDRAAALARFRAGEPCALRFRMPREAFTLRDDILGEVRFAADAYDDFVLRRPDGAPTYHLAVVVDDAAMGVTHVLRGQEHLNNTPRHVALARALGYALPRYAHLPVIQNADGSKMSKRDAGDVSVEDFRRGGFLPSALLNVLALLGFRPGEKLADGSERERFDLDYLARHFSLARVGRSNARFDRDKLLAFNQQTLAEMPAPAFERALQAHAARYGEPEAMAALDRALYARAVRPRCRTLADFFAREGPGGFALSADDAYAFQEKAVAKWLARGEPNGLSHLPALGAALDALAEFTPEAIERAVAEFCAARELKLVAAAQPLRVAVTGGASSPPLGETLALLGRDAVRARIARCLSECG